MKLRIVEKKSETNAVPDLLIWASTHFIVFAEKQPLVDRNDGGHIVIQPRKRISDRQAMTALQAIEYMRLTLVVGEAMSTVLNERGIDVGRINYQDNSNWSVFNPDGPYFHVHLYGRAISARIQPYGESLYFPSRRMHPQLYSHLQPLTPEDVAAIHEKIKSLLRLKKYRASAWT